MRKLRKEDDRVDGVEFQHTPVLANTSSQLPSPCLSHVEGKPRRGWWKNLRNSVC